MLITINLYKLININLFKKIINFFFCYFIKCFKYTSN